MEGCSVGDCAPQVQPLGSGLCSRSPTWRESRLCSSAGCARAGRLSQRTECLVVFFLLPLAVIPRSILLSWRTCSLGSPDPAPPRPAGKPLCFPRTQCARRPREGAGAWGVRLLGSACLSSSQTSAIIHTVTSLAPLPSSHSDPRVVHGLLWVWDSRHLLDSQLSVLHKQYLLYTLIGYLDTDT